MKLKAEIDHLRLLCPTCGTSMEMIRTKNANYFICQSEKGCVEQRLFEIALSPDPTIEVFVGHVQPIFVED